jgi:threonine dehydratase
MPLVMIDAIREAAPRIASVVRRTPVLDVSGPAARPFRIKCESHQPGGAFKIRGATNMLMRLSEQERHRGVITYSSGNHGQAVALAASRLGTDAVVVMPTTAPAVKIDGVKRWGGEVIFEGTTSVARRTRAEEVARERDLVMVPPFDHEWIIEGQGTCGLEILDQLDDVDVVVVPVGGGGLIAGVAAAVKQSRPEIMVVGVEPEGAAKMAASLAAGHPVTLTEAVSIADGLIPVRPGDLTYQHVEAFVDRMLAVRDREIAAAALWLFTEAKQVAEPSGAATTAAVLWPEAGSPLADRGLKVVAIVSGGNISPAALASLETN